MNEIIFYSGIFIFSVFIASVSQILLKKSSMKQYKNLFSQIFNPIVMLSYFVFFVCTLLTILSYKKIPLSLGAIFESSAYIFVPTLSLLFLNEKITTKKLTGMILVVIGIIVFSFK